MKFSFKRAMSMFLVVAMVIAFSAMSVFAAASVALTGENVIVDAGTATVDVKINFTTADVTGFDMLAFTAKADTGLTLTNITVPAAYANDADLETDNVVASGKVYFSNGYKDDYSIAAVASSDIVLTYTIDDPSVAKTYKIQILEAESMFDYDSVAVNTSDASVTVKAEEVPLDATWVTATDAGYYNVDTDVFGLIRFLFDVTVDGEVTETGIKFLKADDITAVIDGTNVTGTAKTFYGDVTSITEADAETTVYAAAYVTVGGQTVWSAPVSCTPDFVKAVIK